MLAGTLTAVDDIAIHISAQHYKSNSFKIYSCYQTLTIFPINKSYQPVLNLLKMQWFDPLHSLTLVLKDIM